MNFYVPYIFSKYNRKLIRSKSIKLEAKFGDESLHKAIQTSIIKINFSVSSSHFFIIFVIFFRSTSQMFISFHYFSF